MWARAAFAGAAQILKRFAEFIIARNVEFGNVETVREILSCRRRGIGDFTSFVPRAPQGFALRNRMNSDRILGRLEIFWLVLAALSLAGCGGSGLPQGLPISGVVTYKGQPLPGGAVYYVPVDKSGGRPAIGRIGLDGRFTMRTTKGIGGVMPGQYGIRLEPDDGLPDDPREAKPTSRVPEIVPIPSKYLQIATSGLEDEVAPGHSGNFNIDLED